MDRVHFVVQSFQGGEVHSIIKDTRIIILHLAVDYYPPPIRVGVRVTVRVTVRVSAPM